MRSSLVQLERLTANAEVATVLDSFLASSDTVESEGRQMKQCWIQYIKNQKNPPVINKEKPIAVVSSKVQLPKAAETAKKCNPAAIIQKNIKS